MNRPLYFNVALVLPWHLGPDASVVLLTAGILLLYLELNRPGSVLPGALGLLATLLSLAAIFQQHISSASAALLLTALALLLLDLFRPSHLLVSLAATLALVLGFYSLAHILTSLVCGILLGAGTSLLTRIARRARTNKRVN